VQLQAFAFLSMTRVGAQIIAESHLVRESRGSSRDEMEVMSPTCGVGLAEPMHFVGQVREVHVLQRLNEGDART
jgi:hypothetical protein